MTSTAFDLMSISVICIASSPLVGLADEQRLELHAELFAPGGVEGVLGVDEGRDAVGLLSLGDDVQGQRRLAARFRAKDLDDAAAGNPLAAQGHVERQAAGRNAGDRQRAVASQRHDRAFAELLLDLLQRRFEVGVVLDQSRAGGLGISPSGLFFFGHAMVDLFSGGGHETTLLYGEEQGSLQVR